MNGARSMSERLRPTVVLGSCLGFVATTAAAAVTATSTDGVFAVPLLSNPPRSIVRAFSSRCFSARMVGRAVGFPAPSPGPRTSFVGSAQLPIGSPLKPKGFVLITWRGTYEAGRSDPFRGSGSGTWQASGLPPSCRHGGKSTAHGTVLLAWASTGAGEVARLRFVGFSP